MPQVTIGDMAQRFMMNRQQYQLKMQVARHSQEMTTGRVADIAGHLSGDYAQLADVEHRLRLLSVYDITAPRAATRAAAMQAALDTIQVQAQDLAGDLLNAGTQLSEASLAALSDNAERAFRTVVGALNTRAANQTLFGGAETDRAALAGANEMLNSLRAAVAGETTYSGYLAAIDNWFDASGGGFETAGYQGSLTDSPDFVVTPGETLRSDLRADDPALREVLKGLAVAALAGDDTLGFSPDLRSDLLIDAGGRLVSNQDRLTGIRAKLGTMQERIEQGTARNQAERNALEISNNALIGVDSYDAATRLEEAQYQLESLYAVTVRMSRLSLLEYLR